jgi:hypothetical protein
MNSEQQELVDEAYENYFNVFEKEWIKQYDSILGDFNHEGRPITQEEFINKVKTDEEFSQKWGLRIEEREFSFEERTKLYNKTLGYGFENKKWVPNQDFIESRLKTDNIPTKLITITYNDKKIESYE